jgi:nucleoid-associated protein YgaU
VTSDEAEAKARAAARAEAEAKAAQAEAEEHARNQAEQEAEASAAKAHAAKEAAAAEEPPDHFICPITHNLMIDPVSAADGHTYERRAIEEWLVGHSTSPMTGAELKIKDLFSNHTVRGLIRTWQEAQQCRPAGPAARP